MRDSTIPTFSVIITCYNYGNYLPLSVQSVLDQTFRDFELIVINDGSTDNTYEAINPFFSDPRVHYIEQANQGQTAAKNAGIALSRGRYIAFLDADDIWERSKLAEQLRLFENPAVGVVYSGASGIDESGQPRRFPKPTGYFIHRRGKVTNHLIFDNFIFFSSAVIRRTCFDKIGTFDSSLKMSIDWDLWLRASVYFEFDFVPKHLIKYRVGHSGQMSRQQSERLRSSKMILIRFLTNNPCFVPLSIVRRTFAYSFCNLGNFYRFTDLSLSNRAFSIAIRISHSYIKAYIGLIYNLFILTLTKHLK